MVGYDKFGRLVTGATKVKGDSWGYLYTDGWVVNRGDDEEDWSEYRKRKEERSKNKDRA